MYGGRGHLCALRTVSPLAGPPFLANGGKIWLCPACAKAKGITTTKLIDGGAIAGAARTMANLASGARVLA